MGQCCPPKELDVIICKSLKKNVCVTFGAPVFNLSGSREPNLPGLYSWNFAVEFMNFDDFLIATHEAGTIEVADNSRIVLASAEYFMRYRMGTMASSPSFRLQFRVREDNEDVFTDNKIIDNGCDNTDDTFEGEAENISNFQMDTSSNFRIFVERLTGTVTAGCANNPNIITAYAFGTIFSDNPTKPILHPYNENNMTVFF